MAMKSEKKQAKQEAKARRRAQKAERRLQRRKAQAVLSQSEIADQLRALASQVESGEFSLGDKEVALPSHAEYTIVYRPQKRGGHQIKAKMQWGPSKTASLLPTE